MSTTRPPAWFDPAICAEASSALRGHLAQGRRRVVLWGPAGVGRTTLLARLSGESDAWCVDAASHDDAAEALARAPEGRPTVVAAIARAGLDADAFVECTPLAPEDDAPRAAWTFFLTLLGRAGAAPAAADAETAALRRVVAHAEGLPRALARAADLLRLMPAAALAARCDEAARQLALFGRRVEHPLLPSERHDARPLDDEARAVATALLAAGESLDLSVAEEFAARHAGPARALDTLLALRDTGALRMLPGGRATLWGSCARALVDWPGFRAAFDAATARLDAEATAVGRAERLRWATTGDPGVLARMEQYTGRLERAAARAQAALGSDPGAPVRLVDAVLALRHRSEVQGVSGPHDEVLRRALDALGEAPEARELRLDGARSLRVAGDVDGAEGALRAFDPDALPPELAGTWHAEMTLVQRGRGAFEQALAHGQRAREVFAALGWRNAEAREVINLGSVYYWQERFDDARDRFEQGRALAARLGARWTEAIALSNLCFCDGFAGNEAAAVRYGRRAIEILRGLGDVGRYGATLGFLGILAFQYGRLDDAARDFEQAEALVASDGPYEQLCFVRFNRAEVALARGLFAEAAARAGALETALAARPDARVSVHLDALFADLFEREGRVAEALVAVERGLARSSPVPPSTLAQLEGQRARVLVRLRQDAPSREAAARARLALLQGAKEEVRASVALVLAHAGYLRGEAGGLGALAEALRPAWEGLAARTRVGVSAADSWAVRSAAGRFWQDLSLADRGVVEWQSRDPDARALCLYEPAGRARLPGGAEIDEAGRRNAYRLVVLLAGAGREGCARAALIADLWPGERIRGDAAANRLHNAVAQLRAGGLGADLVRDARGYRIEAHVRVVRAGQDDPLARVPVAR